jgi:arsenate reductase
MAEAFLRDLAGDRFEAHSAGSAPKGLHPLTVKVMAEVGIDVSGAASTHLEAYLGQPFDRVITTCAEAEEACPVWPGANVLHWRFADPAAATGSEEERLEVFRSVRDQIKERISRFLAGAQ